MPRPSLPRRYRALYPYEAADQSEVTFDEDDIMAAVEGAEPSTGWIMVEVKGHQGYAPETYMEELRDSGGGEGVKSDGVEDVRSDITEGVRSDGVEGVRSDITEGVRNDGMEGVTSDVAKDVRSDVVKGVKSDGGEDVSVKKSKEQEQTQPRQAGEIAHPPTPHNPHAHTHTPHTHEHTHTHTRTHIRDTHKHMHTHAHTHTRTHTHTHAHTDSFPTQPH